MKKLNPSSRLASESGEMNGVPNASTKMLMKSLESKPSTNDDDDDDDNDYMDQRIADWRENGESLSLQQRKGAAGQRGNSAAVQQCNGESVQ